MAQVRIISTKKEDVHRNIYNVTTSKSTEIYIDMQRSTYPSELGANCLTLIENENTVYSK